MELRLRTPGLFITISRYGLLALLFVFMGGNLTAQITISGRLQERGTGDGIPFANIGIENSTAGSLSNADGTFSIEIPEALAGRELLLSSLGYHPQYHKVRDLAREKELRIFLEPKIVALDPITLIPEKTIKKKSVTFGNGKSLLLSGQLAYDSIYAGSAIALRIDKDPHPNLRYIQGVSLFIAGNKSPEFKVRLRFMAIDSTEGGIPGRDLIEDQILEFSSIKRGWLEFDLPGACRVDEASFYLVFEWILEKEDRQYIAEKYKNYMAEYPDRVSYDTILVDGKEVVDIRIGKILAGTIFGTTTSKSDLERFPTYYRGTSFGSWERAGSTLSAKVEIGNYPPDP